MGEAALLDIVTQHAEEAAFLWLLRTSAARWPNFRLRDLDDLDERVEAHIDGLRIAGDEGWHLAAKELTWKEAGEGFVAALLAFERNDQAEIQSVLCVAAKTLGLSRGFISALGWLDYPQAESHIQRLCASQSPAEKRVGIAAAAIHRKDPGRALTDAVLDPDRLLRARAFRAAGELGRTDLVPLMQRDLNSKDPCCQFWAAWSTALLVGYRNAIEVLQSIAESSNPYHERALHLALRRLDLNSTHAWHEQLAKNQKRARMAVIAAGVIGDPALIPWLIDQMSIPPLYRIAGEAFEMITGVDIAYEDLDGEKPEGFEPGPTEDPRDDNVEMDPDERLPWPDPNLVAAWWDKRGGEFRQGLRYLLGKPISAERMHHVLRTGRQRQRAAAALELAIMQPGEPMFEVRAPGFRQQELLRLATAG